MKTASIFAGIIVLAILTSTIANGQLSSTYYAKSCPQALSIVKGVVAQAVAKERRMGASLIRLHFHDCFINGCDGSVLLDDTPTFTGEKSAIENAKSLRGFDVIDTIKSRLEAACSGVVSCADILAIAARDSVVLSGGPSWIPQLGRRDSTTANLSGVNINLPSPFSDLNTLTSKFQDQGLSANDMIALSGAHTIGQVRCVIIRTRIYNETNIDSTFAASIQTKCPSNNGDSNLSPLDLVTPNVFDNTFFKNLKTKKGLLHTDQVLFNGDSSDSLVNTYSVNSSAFFTDFTTAMVKMGNISPLIGTNGEIRKHCSKIN